MFTDIVSSSNRIYSSSTKVLPGGYALSGGTYVKGDVIPKGTLVSVDNSTRTAEVITSTSTKLPNAVTYSDVVVDDPENITLDIAIEAIVYAHNYTLDDSWVTSTKLCLAENHSIVFI